MSTNFYARPPGACVAPCAHCRADAFYICKSFTSWRGYRSGLVVDRYGPLLAVRDYLELLGYPGWSIVDEYDQDWPYDDFVRAVGRIPQESRGAQHRWILSHRHMPSVIGDLDHYWLDPDGYSFFDGEFS